MGGTVTSWLITASNGDSPYLVHDDADVRVYLMSKVEGEQPRLNQPDFLYWIGQACRTPPLTFGPLPSGAVYQVEPVE